MRVRANRRIVAGVLSAVVLAGATAVGTAAPAAAHRTAGPHTEVRHELRDGVRDLRDLGITGVHGLVRDGRRDVWARAGVADTSTGRPVPHNGYFRIGSNTKTFVAVLALQLVGEGRLGLDDPVERWLPGVVTGNGHDGRRITVRQLLQHTSGLPNYTYYMPELASAEQFLAHRFDPYPPEELVAIALAHEPDFPPGQGWNYSNTNYILAGMIIERVTGRSWPVELRDRILRPLGMRHTLAPGNWTGVPRPHARGYQQFTPGGPLVDTTEFNPEMAWTAGDIISTPADLATFWQALMRGRLLAPAQQAQLLDTVLAETLQDFMPGARYGLGIMWIPNSCGGHWSHGGDVFGTSNVNGVTDRGERAVVLTLTTQLAGEAALPVLQRSEGLVAEVLCD